MSNPVDVKISEASDTQNELEDGERRLAGGCPVPDGQHAA